MLCGVLGYAAFENDAPDNLLIGFDFYNPFWVINIGNIFIAIHLIGVYQIYIKQADIKRWSKTWIWLQILSMACLMISLAAACGLIQGLIHAVADLLSMNNHRVASTELTSHSRSHRLSFRLQRCSRKIRAHKRYLSLTPANANALASHDLKPHCLLSRVRVVPRLVHWLMTPIMSKKSIRLQNRVGFGLTQIVSGQFRIRPELDPKNVIACAKHFVGDRGTHRGINEGNTNCSFEEPENIHIMPYRDCLDQGFCTIMASYSSWNDRALHSDQYLETDILKGKLGFKGFLISDWEGIDRLTWPHGSNYRYCISALVNAGIDMIMVPHRYERFLEDIVYSGEIPMPRIDDAVERILRVKFVAGLFEQPFSDRSLTSIVHCKTLRYEFRFPMGASPYGIGDPCDNVKRILVDDRSSVYVLFYSTFLHMGLTREKLQPVDGLLYGFDNRSVRAEETISLPVIAPINLWDLRFHPSHKDEVSYLGRSQDGVLPEEPIVVTRFRRQAANFITIGDELYKRVFTGPYLRCLPPSEADYALREVYSGVCGEHLKGRALAYKIMR
ncbi:hypothetical protein KFK09_014363 [Dendrobium nobile]|uniref:Beta-glucosidase n=1 Tax=Dendrobium nobile TaxID=94219 RepID=A0A8T3BBQ9_DENNO|nr:hypothetical protein KFK09_014363 [Dendrobium nobile]